MKNISIKLILIFIISCSLSGQALAFYKQKVIVTEFDDPEGWEKNYSPGKFFSKTLKRKLMENGQFHLLSPKVNDHLMHNRLPDRSMMEFSSEGMKNEMMLNERLQNNMQMDLPDKISKSVLPLNKYMKNPKRRNNSSSFIPKYSHANLQYQAELEPAIHYIHNEGMVDVLPIQGEVMMQKDGMMKDIDKIGSKDTIMHDPVPWPVKLGKMPEKASLYEIRGQVKKFDPGNMKTDIMNHGNTNISEQAELEIILQIVQNKTGRTVYKKLFKASSNSGRRAFSKDIDLDLDREDSLELSSMNLAFSFLTNEMAYYVNNTISKKPLEGEIIAIKGQDVLINIGSQNGVQVGDRFRVHSMGIGLDDPLTEEDLGDIYVKMGGIKVFESMLGFSRARIIFGKDFMPGNLVRSFKQFNKGSQELTPGETISQSEDPLSWRSFHDIK
jgi:hypothetical protein